MTRNFRSSILELNPTVRAELEELIEKGTSGLSIYNTLKQKYEPQIKVPTVPTILRYVKYYQLKKRDTQKKLVEEKLACDFGDGITEIENIVARVTQNEEPTFNKIRLLEGLVAKCLCRITSLESSLQGQKANPSIENAIVRYVSEVKTLAETITKLSAESQQSETVLIQMIRNEAKTVLEVIREIILDICPEKYDLFKEKLRRKLQDKGLEVSTQTKVTELSKDTEQILKEEVTVQVSPVEPSQETSTEPSQQQNAEPK